ncbi:histidine kinase [Gracilibacillus caseinilyticus]|uniref:Histidine kinase n=1 Tax=Gracilibacillus caseinilyticus TaxID=2932256 RepID=A0ABY4F1N2_9BACI|nr:sensor histidine kinase [Gracilibacillus caseinilyticus]UOQ50443.1 histidine kinase [Gracilibacillus caseinilyticus]
MNNRILIKNILLFVFPLLIPVFILGSFAIVITDKYIKESITANNRNVLQQLEQQTNTVLNEMYLLNLDYNWNPDITLSLRNFFDSEHFNYLDIKMIDYEEGNLRRKEIATSYIHSMYIYYENDNDRVLTSRSGFMNIANMHDDTWLKEYDAKSTNRDIWMENRQISQYDFENEEPVISIYRNIFNSNAQTSEGLIVLNIYQSYFENLISELNNYHNQSIFVLDETNTKLYGNNISEELALEEEIIENRKQTFEVQLDGTSYIVSQLQSDLYPLRYYSMVENNIIYRVPNQLLFLTILFVLSSLILGTATIYYLSRKNARHVGDIIKILNTTNQNEQDLIRHISFKDNEYQYIVRRILKHYIAQNELEKELNEKKYELQAAELLALQNQINPHFLSNTLAIIYWRAMALTGKPNKVTKMVETLTDILNFSLRIRHHTVTLEEEMNNTKNYLEILRVRSDKDFRITWDYHEQDQSIQVLKFVLQPLIENSIQHGMDYESEASQIDIKIKIRTKGDGTIRFTVIDNGQGISKSDLSILRNKLDKDEYVTNHIGLANINKRLSLIYNNQFSFIIKSKRTYGTVITIEHPV